MIIRTTAIVVTWQCLNYLQSKSQKTKFSLSAAEITLLALAIIRAIVSKPARDLFKKTQEMFLEAQLFDLGFHLACYNIQRTSFAYTFMRGREGFEACRRRTERDLRLDRRDHDFLCEIDRLVHRSKIRKFNSLVTANPLYNLFWPFFWLSKPAKVKQRLPFPVIDSSVTTQALLNQVRQDAFLRSSRDHSSSTYRNSQSRESARGHFSWSADILDKYQPILSRQSAKIHEIWQWLSDREDLERQLDPQSFNPNESHVEEIPAEETERGNF